MADPPGGQITGMPEIRQAGRYEESPESRKPGKPKRPFPPGGAHQRGGDGARVVPHDDEQHDSRAARPAITALPVTQRSEAKAEAAAELLLGHMHALAKRDDVDLLGAEVHLLSFKKSNPLDEGAAGRGLPVLRG
jgi:hypothetical protein